MATDNTGIPEAYYEAPYSLTNMSDEIRNGLLAIGTLATMSLVLTSGLLAFITWRMITWRSHYTRAVARNQAVVLIYQLILADFFQSLGFLLSFYWTSLRLIAGPEGACFAQGILIQFGDVASAFFVLAIAAHTTYQVVLSRNVPYKMFVLYILVIWAFALLLTCLVPIVGGRYVILRAGIWIEVLGCYQNP
ncbi:hypothetical protein JX265_013689 [Neoarthrinium moseri]|uniref:G-protein coupled receptors family 1 profile domain-containing protein n=1 Tax=Neoarthrinium moseri TaxID=1658444 RepID=A0A9Q0AIB7_9PEZI|nr:hypothetical protein JX265_013689 [Neoarthrinium moseri]